MGVGFLGYTVFSCFWLFCDLFFAFLLFDSWLWIINKMAPGASFFTYSLIYQVLFIPNPKTLSFSDIIAVHEKTFVKKKKQKHNNFIQQSA